MASPKIEYMLELSHENGNALADEDYARLTSNSPLPVPSVGDLVKLPGIQAKVMSRIFSISGNNLILFHIQVFCRDVKKKTG
jgi:hypothetical protein